MFILKQCKKYKNRQLDLLFILI